MDLKDIEGWSRELLQSEASKRGVKNPEVYSRSELVRLILQDVGAPTNIKEAARLIGGMLGSAKAVLRSRLAAGSARMLKGANVRTAGAARDAERAKREAETVPYADWARENERRWSKQEQRALLEEERVRSEDEQRVLREEERVRSESRDKRRDSDRVRADARAAGVLPDGAGYERPEPGWHQVTIARAKVPHEFEPDSRVLSPWTPEVVGEEAVSVPRPDDRPENQSGVRRAVDVLALAEESEVETPKPNLRLATAPAEHISYGPHPQHGLRLRWSVTPEAIERARLVLGHEGELAVRIVAVRVEPPAIVKTEVIDHGPVKEAGDWTAPLQAAKARYVTSIGLRSSTRFVSIVHASS